MDTIDWKFEVYYKKALEEKNFDKALEISNIYLQSIKDMIDRNERWSCDLLNRNPKHILLTHAADITIEAVFSY